MSFWRDREGAIWVDNYTGRTMFCMWDPDVPDDEYEIGLPMQTREVIDTFGPLHWIHPSDWQMEIEKTKEFRGD